MLVWCVPVIFIYSRAVFLCPFPPLSICHSKQLPTLLVPSMSQMHIRVKEKKNKIMLFSSSKIQTVQEWGPPSAKTADILHQYIPILAKKTCSLGAKEHYFKNQTKCLGRNKGLQTACPLLSQLSLSWRQKGSQNEGGHGSVPCCQWMASELPEATGTQHQNTDLHKTKHNSMDCGRPHTICIEGDSFLVYILGNKISTPSNDVNSGTYWLKIKVYSS